MKQTSGALSFLLSAYRSIFSAAYAKGIAAAVVLTAGLAAGASQAAELDLSTSFEAAKDAAITVVNDASGSSISLPADTGTQPGLKYANGMNVTAPLTVTGYGSVAVTGDMTINGKLTVTGTASGGKATQIFGTDQEMAEDRKSWVTDHTVNFGSNADVEMSNNASITFETVNIDGSKIKLNGSATITAWGYGEAPSAQSSFDDTVNYLNADMSIRNAEISLSGSTTMDANDGMSISNTKIDVTGGTGNTIRALLQGNADEMTVSDSQITVAKSSALKIETTSVSMTGGSLTNNEGTITFTGDAEIDDSVTVKSTGTTNFSGDLSISADDFTGLFGKSGDAIVGKVVLDDGVAVEITGTGEVDLGAIVKTTGAITAENNTLSFADGTLNLGATYDEDNLDLSVATLKVGDSGHSFALNSGAAITVSEGIVFETAATEDNANTFTISGADDSSVVSSLTLNGVTGDLGGASYQVGTASSGGSLVVAAGEWSNAAGLTVLGTGSVTVKNGASLTVGNLTSAIGDGISVDGGSLTATGELALTQKGVVDVTNAGTFAVKASEVIQADGSLADGTNNYVASGASFDAVSYFVLNDADAVLGASIDTTKLSAVKTALGMDNGILSLDGVTVDIASGDFVTDTDSVKYSSATATYAGTDALKDYNVAEVNTSSIALTGAHVWGSATLADGQNTLTVNEGTSSAQSGLTLTNAATNNGLFVSAEDADGNVVAGNIAASGNTIINLQGSGEIGDITGTASSSTYPTVMIGGEGANNTIGSVSNLAEFTVTGASATADAIDVTEFNVNTSLTSAISNPEADADAQTRFDITAATLNVAATGSIVTNTLTVGGDATESAAGTDSFIKGNVTAESVTFVTPSSNTNTAVISDNASVVADTVTLKSGSTVYVGSDGEDGSAGFLTAGTLVLDAGSNLIIDPDYDKAVGLAVAQDLDSDSTSAGADHVLGGNLLVGQNSAFGYGFDSVTELRAAIGEYLNGHGGLNEEDIGSLVYLNKTLALGTGTAGAGNLYINATADQAALNSQVTSLASVSGSVSLGANSALIIGDELNIAQDESGNGAYAITGASGSVTADAKSKVVVLGAYTADDTLNLVSGTGITTTGAGFDAELIVGNGLLEKAAVNKTSTAVTATLKIAEDFDAKLYNASNPVKGVMRSAFNGEGDASQTGVDYILNVGGKDGGKSVEATSRLGVYGGAVQAAMLASQTSTDAVADRLGMANSNSALVYADNAQGGGLWLMPVYRSMDSEDFAAQGVDYGTDIDLYGVALGADFTTDSGVRVGGYFNVGSGDADGQQVASEVSNDFDYYGVGIYAGMNFGQFSLIADMGFTQVSNDLEQNAYYAGKLTADADSSAVTAGLRAEYALELAAVDVVPHLGVRYTRLDMDSYDVTGADGVYASTSSDSMSVFSIPFGVSVSTDIEAGNWSVKPVFDVTLTANTGDDELDSDTTFTGAGMTSALSTEVLDSFTYGGTVGVQAKYGETLSLGVGLNYTGSDNTDSFGVTGDIRYMF